MIRRTGVLLAMALCACMARAIVVAGRPCPASMPDGADAGPTAAAVVGAAVTAADRDGGPPPSARGDERDAPVSTTVVATTVGDLDVDGRDETIRLYADGALRVFHGDDEVPDAYGQHAGAVVPFEAVPSEGGATFALRVVDIDRRDRQRELMLLEMRGDEDPPGQHTFWVYRERRLWPMLRRPMSEGWSVTVPHGEGARIAGDGAVRFEYDRCVRDADRRAHTRGITEHVSLRYTLTDGALPRGELMESVRTARRPSDCIQVACPVVRVGASQLRAGEILRELRGEASTRWQSLALPPTAVDGDGVLRVTLGEEKREITQLDGVYVDADGRRVAPDGCDAATSTADGAAPWCVADGASATLTPGATVSLRFRVGAARAVTLWARGHYVTLPARDDPSEAQSP